MTPWLRVLAAFGFAIAAALFLKVLPPLIVLVFFIGGIAAVNLGLRRKVKDEGKGFTSEALGLKLEREARKGGVQVDGRHEREVAAEPLTG
jgi:hypothetical protein